MFIPNKRNINIISLVISIIIFILVNIFFLEYKKVKFAVSFNSTEASNILISNEIQENNTIEENEIQEENTAESFDAKWTIEIPDIDLKAEIAQGTSQEVMNNYVGHFEETQLEFGNIGLAAHNRGYPVNYFQDLKKLEEGDEIIYKHEDFEMTYTVETMEIIENTNWEYLENTEDNRITLITCVENEPKYRRCIQGIEKIEREEF